MYTASLTSAKRERERGGGKDRERNTEREIERRSSRWFCGGIGDAYWRIVPKLGIRFRLTLRRCSLRVAPEAYLLSLPTHYPIIVIRSETGPISVAKPYRSSRAEIQGNANCVLRIRGVSLDTWRVLGNRVPWSLQFRNWCRVVSEEWTTMTIMKRSSIFTFHRMRVCQAQWSIGSQFSWPTIADWMGILISRIPISDEVHQRVHVAPAVRINVRTEKARRPRAMR